MEPHYSCGLCESQGQSNCMFAHLIGRKHRKNFASLKLGEEAVLDASQVSVCPVLQPEQTQ